MSGQSRREYIRTQRARYRSATRTGKQRILDEGCEMFGMHRKSLIRALGRAAVRSARRAGRPRVYDETLLATLKKIWLTAEQPCSKRLAALLPTWLPYYERHHGALDAEVRDRLLAASPSTLDRLLRPLRARRKGLCGTRAVRRLEGQIPIRTNFHEVEGPGTLEADTVAHCGDSMAGAFVWTLTLTDIWSGWTESRAVWNKSSRQITERLRDIEERLAFDILAFDTDNGGEFINRRLCRHFHERARPVHFTRSRPYHKNDQAHVEQKQWTHVRQLLGYRRLDDRRLVPLIDDLLGGPWRDLQNFFLPSMQLQSKSREGAHWRRRHGKPTTPYQRLLNSDKVSVETQEQLRREFQTLDPFELHDQIETRLRAIFRLARLHQKPATPTRRKRDRKIPPKAIAEMPRKKVAQAPRKQVLNHVEKKLPKPPLRPDPSVASSIDATRRSKTSIWADRFLS